MKNPRALSRRSFICTAIAASGGLAIGLRFAAPARAQTLAQGGLDAWLQIAPDNRTTIYIPRQEMGQGSFTALSQFIAEELDLDWSTITAVHASPVTNLTHNRIYGRMNTGGSRGVRENHQLMRTAGAQVRLMLIRAAAVRLEVPEAELTTADSVIIHARTGRSLKYGDIAAAAVELPIPDARSIVLREPKDWKVIGKPLKRIEAPEKVTGAATYGIDVSFPGMKYAAVMFSPVFKGKLVSYDAKAALSRPGVHKVVEVTRSETGPGLISDDGIAVIADSWWHAKTALEAMPKEWDGGANANVSSAAILADFHVGLDVPSPKPLRSVGDIKQALKSAAKIVQSDYYVPFLEHAPIEPINCTSLVTDDRFDVWVGTQNPERALEIAATLAGLPPTSGDVHCAFLGGSFGRRSQPQDFVHQSVQIAIAMKGTPVKMLWTREETMQHGFYRPATLARLSGGLDPQGRLVAWQHRMVNQSPDPVSAYLGAEDQPFLAVIPDVLVEHVLRPGHVPFGNMRGVAYSQSIFFVQSFIDELAVASGQDGYRFQRALLDPARLPEKMDKREDIAERLARMRAVLDEAARRAGWGRNKGPLQGRGIAVSDEANSAVACVVDVTLDGKGWLKIDRVLFAVDPGIAVNPNMLTAQLEGAAALAVNSTLYSEITIERGRVKQSNFDNYPLLRIRDMPKVEVFFLPSGKTFGGMGEPGVGPVAPALANAIFNAGGPRVRRLPLRNESLAPRVDTRG